jgi:hypothetical protein
VQRNPAIPATVLPDEKTAYADESYATPPGASDAARNALANGWTSWLAGTPDGLFTLAALREQFLAHQE